MVPVDFISLTPTLTASFCRKGRASRKRNFIKELLAEASTLEALMVTFSMKHLLSLEMLPPLAKASAQGQQKATRASTSASGCSPGVPGLPRCDVGSAGAFPRLVCPPDPAQDSEGAVGT